MPGLKLNNVRKSYNAVEVIHDVSFQVAQGEFMVFVGPSGCGKSTLLRMIAGLEDISAGSIEIDEVVVNNIAAAKRGIAMVFQNYGLYPHMTVFDNMAFGLQIAKMPKGQIEVSVSKAAEMLQLTPYLRRFPRQLSGGQRQRVAIGRAITRNPKIFLFDEPLSNLDAALRVATRVELARLKQEMPSTTMIYVTHDQVEAMTLADRIVVLNKGVVEQIGAPLELYYHPKNLFVATFIGSPAMNMIEAKIAGEIADGRVALAVGDRKLSASVNVPASDIGQPAKVGIRPENLRIVDAGSAVFSGQVSMIEHLGETTNLYVDTEDRISLLAKVGEGLSVRRGDRVNLATSEDSIHVFGSSGDAYPVSKASKRGLLTTTGAEAR